MREGVCQVWLGPMVRPKFIPQLRRCVFVFQGFFLQMAKRPRNSWEGSPVAPGGWSSIGSDDDEEEVVASEVCFVSDEDVVLLSLRESAESPAMPTR